MYFSFGVLKLYILQIQIYWWNSSCSKLCHGKEQANFRATTIYSENVTHLSEKFCMVPHIKFICLTRYCSNLLFFLLTIKTTKNVQKNMSNLVQAFLSNLLKFRLTNIRC